MIILDLKGGAYYGLDAVGASVWSLIQEPKTLGEIRNVILEEYEVEPQRRDRLVFNWGTLDRRETRRALKIREAVQLVIWHGRVDIRRKGLDILLDAWKEVCQRRQERDLQLLMVGTR